METENQLTHQFRKIKLIHLLITASVIFLLATPYFILDYNYDGINNNEYKSIPLHKNPVQNVSCSDYKIALFIFSEMEQIDKRMLMREELFGITDNLIPCMKQDTSEIFYKFFVRKTEEINKNILYLHTSEQMEYNDIVEIDVQSEDDWHQSLLEYAKSLQHNCTTFDHLVIIDIFTMINLEEIKNKISSSKTSIDTQKMVWGSFNSIRTENMAAIIGSSAIRPILNNLNLKLKNTSILSSLYHYYDKNSNEKIPSGLIFINDPVGIIEWPNTIKNIDCIDCIVAIGHLFQDLEFRQIKNKLNISTTLPCNVRSDLEMYSKKTTSELRPNIAVVTSSYLYENCMLEAGPLSATNKREYAERFGYAFVPRSVEFVQQICRNRKAAWGKIDAIEKVLPYYEWILWLDIDAIFVNRSLSVERLLKMSEERAGGKEAFEKINMIIARPIGDRMINTGVFLIRNSAWAKDFLKRGIQPRYDLYHAGTLEQQAMRDAMLRPDWKPNVLYLDGDDHTINTSPNRYIRGDYIVHYASVNRCPARFMLNGLRKLQMLEKSPNVLISIPF